jgi:hypothetical protein
VAASPIEVNVKMITRFPPESSREAASVGQSFRNIAGAPSFVRLEEQLCRTIEATRKP